MKNKTKENIFDCSATKQKSWSCYEVNKEDDGTFTMRLFCQGANVGDIIYILPAFLKFIPEKENQINYFEIMEIVERRDHKGVFVNEKLQKDSYMVVNCRQLTPADKAILRENGLVK